jgi:peptidyl-prolyl cis-trans isomerase-like 4
MISISKFLSFLQISNKIALDQSVNEDEGKTAEQIKREIEDRDLKTHAQILEMVGDIHDVDDRPPDNVLFVCKLNPATTDEDLEMIFSQCGEIVECEIIRNKRNNASLQYAFIEFKTVSPFNAVFFNQILFSARGMRTRLFEDGQRAH